MNFFSINISPRDGTGEVCPFRPDQGLQPSLTDELQLGPFF